MTKEEAQELIAEIEKSHKDDGFQEQQRIKKIINRFVNKKTSTIIYNYEDDETSIRQDKPIYGFIELEAGCMGATLALNNITENTYDAMVLTSVELKQLRHNIDKVLEYLDENT